MEEKLGFIDWFKKLREINRKIRIPFFSYMPLEIQYSDGGLMMADGHVCNNKKEYDEYKNSETYKHNLKLIEAQFNHDCENNRKYKQTDYRL